jgi:N-acetylglucosamine kinase-like BadF-type ATPase
MILIADSGSTKTDWVLINEKEQFRYKTIGYNPYFINSENIYYSLTEKLVTQFDPSVVTSIYFYGAGCSSDNNITIVNQALTRCFVNSKVSVGHDMLAAARALLGNQEGFAAIIGTGSNTCIYNGNAIQQNIDSLGYLLGDEGSGSYIGKKLIRDYLRGYLPSELEKKFTEKYSLSPIAIFDSLYNKPLPNRFLASFCVFADENKNHPYIKKIVRKAFDDFFTNLVSMYPGYKNYQFNCVGSVGFIFKNVLEEVSRSFDMKPGRIIHSPIDDLVNYHLTHSK